MKVRVFTRSRTALGVVLGIGLAAGCAFAAWVIYTGVTGTATGKFGTAPTMAALTFATDTTNTAVPVVPCDTGSGATCTGGTLGKIFYVVTDNNGASETWNTPGVTLTTSDDGAPDLCSTHLFVQASTTFTTSYNNGTSGPQVINYVADPSTPLGCSNATVTATFTGTTSP